MKLLENFSLHKLFLFLETKVQTWGIVNWGTDLKSYVFRISTSGKLNVHFFKTDDVILI